MDVTFVLEESGVTATVEVPCEADVAAAKEVACTALAVSPASVEMRIGTQVLEGTCRLQDTAFDAGVQVVLACPRLADIKCPAEYTVPQDTGDLSLSPRGTLCVYSHNGVSTRVGGFDTETFDTAFEFNIDLSGRGPPAVSQCKTRCYMACEDCLLEVALPGGEVLRKVECTSMAVFACGSVVVSQGIDGVSVYDEDLKLLRSLSHEECWHAAVSPCGGWVITYSVKEENVRLWDVNTGETVSCREQAEWWRGCWCIGVALSRSASLFATGESYGVQLYDWSGASLRSVAVDGSIGGMQFTPCGKYLVVRVVVFLEHSGYSTDHEFDPDYDDDCCAIDYMELRQYDVATMSCVHVIQEACESFEISPCSRVVVFAEVPRCESDEGGENATTSFIVTRLLYPHNSE